MKLSMTVCTEYHTFFHLSYDPGFSPTCLYRIRDRSFFIYLMMKVKSYRLILTTDLTPKRSLVIRYHLIEPVTALLGALLFSSFPFGALAMIPCPIISSHFI